MLDHYDSERSIPKNGSQVLTSAKDRDEAIQIAGFLAAYNEGQADQRHCGEVRASPVSARASTIMWPIALAPIAAAIMRRRRRLAA